MASLSAQPSRKDTDESFISFTRQPPHRFIRAHQYYQQHATNHPAIYPMVFIQHGSVVSAGGYSGLQKAADGGDSDPDYDNLIPPVRLDRIVEDETDREDCSINTVHYDHAATRGSSDLHTGDSDGAKQGAHSGVAGGRCHSEDRYNYTHRSCSYDGDHTGSGGNSVVREEAIPCEFTDNNNSKMGNVLLTSRSDSVSDSSSAFGSKGENKEKCNLVVSSTRTHMDVNTGEYSSRGVFDRDHTNIKFTEKSEMPSRSFITDTSAMESLNVAESSSVDLSTHQQEWCSTLTKTPTASGHSSKTHANSEIILSEHEAPSRSINRTSETRQKASDLKTSAKFTSEKNSFTMPATENLTSFSSTREGRKLEHQVSETKTHSTKKPCYDHETHKETEYNRHVPSGQTPIIVITTSTPKKKKPSNTSTTTQLTDCDRQQREVPSADAPRCNGTEKTNEKNRDSKENHVTQTNNASFLDSKHAIALQTDEDGLAAGFAPVDEFSVPPSSYTCNDHENIDKKVSPETVTGYENATVFDQHSSCPGHNTSPCATNNVTPLTKVTEDKSMYKEEPDVNLSYTVAAVEVASVSSTPTPTVSITTETRQSVSNTTQANVSMHQTAAECNPNSYIHRPTVKIKAEGTKETAVEDILGDYTVPCDVTVDYTVPCDVTREYALLLPQGDYTKANIEEFPIANKGKHNNTPREPLDSLIETDSMSLSEPQYTEIPEAVDSGVTKSNFGSFMIASNNTHYRIVRLCDPSERHLDSDDDDDAIYAVPIPKSQRKTEQFKTSATDHPSLNPQQETDSPPKPARSPIYNTDSTAFEDTDAFCNTPVTRSKVQLTCQMKKPTTTRRFYSDSSDYDYSNIPKFGRYDFFSLGRRPKRLRGNALRHSKEVSVSLEMLLKVRHENSADMSVTPAVDQTVSVDDILRSCREFEESNVYYRGRTSSDSMQNSFSCSLSFVEMANIKKHMHDAKESEKQKLHQSTAFKRSDIESKQNGALKVHQHPETSSHLHVIELDASSRTENGIGIQSHNGTHINLAPASPLASTDSSRNNSQVIERNSLLSASAKESSGQQKFASRSENETTLESVQPRFNLNLADNEKNGMIYNREVKNCSAVSRDIKYSIRSDHAMQNCDYDTLDTIPTSASISPHEKVNNSSFPQGISCTHNGDNLGINRQTRSTDEATLYSQPCFPVSPSEKPLEINREPRPREITSTHEALQPQPLSQSLPSPSSELTRQTVSLPTYPQEIRPPQQTTPYICWSALSVVDPAESLMSSSDVASPASPVSTWSASSDAFSPGAVSIRSIEDTFSETSVDDLQSPTQKPPFCYARLEIVEALKWLRAAGFPQYAQMFDDGQFPVDTGVIERDHDFLDQDSLKSLFRRLETLNKHAGLPLDTIPGKKAACEEEEDEVLCALSDRWEYKKSIRRWSRKGVAPSSRHTAVMGSDQNQVAGHSDSHDSLLDQDGDSPVEDSPLSGVKPTHLLHSSEQENGSDLRPDKQIEMTTRGQNLNGAPFSTSSSAVVNEKNKPPQNLFRKMEGLKSKRSRGMSKRRNIVDISGPIVEDNEVLRAKLERLNCVDISPSSSSSSKTFRSQPTAGVKPFNLGTHSTSIESKVNQTPCKFSTSHISVHSTVCSTSETTLSRYESRPDDTISPLLKQSAIHSSSLTSSAIQPSTESDCKRSTHNQVAATQRTSSVFPLQRDMVLEKAINDLDVKEVIPRVDNCQQPGRFHRVLQNGRVQTESDHAVVDARNTSLHSNTSDITEANKLNSYSSALRHRNSVYDNILSDDKQEGQEKSRMIFPGIYELESSDSGVYSRDHSDTFVVSNAQRRVEVRQDNFTQDLNSEYVQRGTGSVSLDVSLVSSSVGSCEQTYGSSVRDRSVCFETTPPLQSPRESTPSSDAGISNSDIRSGLKSSSDSATSKSKAVIHSASLDSYFQNGDVQRNINSCESDDSPPRIPQKEYDDFDLILQQLYQNISDLSDYVNREPGNPVSSLDTNDSLEFDGALDHDPENSFSGGEGSNTAESSSEDPEVVTTDVSRDSLDQISGVSRERRDSGVGHSLPRAPSERRQKKLRWHSFQNSHKPDISSRPMQINHLTVYQMVRLQKLCLLKLTAIMEKSLPISRSGWNWIMPRFMKKQKTLDFIDRKVFGVPLSVIAQRTGQPLPQCVLYAMRYLRRTSSSAVGIFRKSGVKSKIQQLRDHLEANPDTVDFEGTNPYSVADMLKTYFRDLPECLLTNKMSEIFRSIYMHVPPCQRLEAIQTAIVLLPDENREVLQSILLFLSDISSHEADHQMNASNLAVCFTPTVFQLGPQQMTAHSPKRNHKTSIAVPDPREIMEQKAAHECLLMMILECKKLFTVLPSLYQQLQVHSVTRVMPVPVLDIGIAPSDVRAFGQERIQIILKEAHDKNRGWIQAYTVGDVEVFHRKPMDDCPLKEWKLIVEIEAPPIEVLHRILHERHVWDEDLLSWSVVERLDPHSDIFQFVLNSMAPHPFRHFCVLRYWRSDLNKGACALTTMSVEHSDHMEVQGVWAVDLGSYFLMEHCGSGRSRLTYITRLDTRGRSPEWYTRIFGHISAHFLARLKESFRQVTPGPETRV